MLRKFFTCSQNIIHFVCIADQHRLGALGSVQEIIVLSAAAILRQTGIFPTPRITDRTGASAAVLQQLVQPIGQLRIIGRCIERHTDLAQESRVVNALMRFSVCRNKTRAVNGEHDVLLQQIHIVQDLIDHDRLGEIYYSKATYLRRKGCPGGWFGDKARSGGGPLIDLGVHVIDLTRYLMGKPKPVSIYGATFHKLGDRRSIKSERGYVSATQEDGGPIFNVEDLASAMIRYDNGAVLQVEASFSLNLEKDTGTIELFGDKGGLRLDPELTYFGEMDGYMTNVTLAAKTALSFDGLFANEINHFVHCVQTGEPCRNPAEDGVEMMKILDAVYESAATGHEVILK